MVPGTHTATPPPDAEPVEPPLAPSVVDPSEAATLGALA